MAVVWWEGPRVIVVSTVNCLSTNDALSLAILITSNFYISRLFASIPSTPPLRKILAAPLLLTPNRHFLVKFWKCQKAVSILPHQA